MKPNTNKYHIIGHLLCPYVQRAVIVMHEKRIPYERTDIDLNCKPNWLAALSPTGKVPILIVNDDLVLFESNVISEFLDETSQGSLHPVCIMKKALHRSWIEFGTQILDHIARIIYRDKSAESFESTMAQIARMLKLVERKIEGTEYFTQTKFHLIDAVYSTIFRYFEVLIPLSCVDPFQGLTKTQKWRGALQERKSVQNAVPSNYNELLSNFIIKCDSYTARQLKGAINHF